MVEVETVQGRVGQLGPKFRQATSWMQPELLTIPRETIEAWMAENAELAEWRDILLAKIEEDNPGLVGIDWDYKETKPQMQVVIDYARAADLGLTQMIARSSGSSGSSSTEV